MSSLSDILDFERFNLRKIGRAIKEDPERLFLGALGPFGTELWGKVLGKDYGKLVNPLGAPVESTYEEAEAAGVNTGPGRSMHDIAQVIAGSIAGGYGADKLGGAGLGLGEKIPGGGNFGGFGFGGGGNAPAQRIREPYMSPQGAPLVVGNVDPVYTPRRVGNRQRMLADMIKKGAV